MKIALLGATGFVGSALLDEALDRGHQVTAVVRNPAKLPQHVGWVGSINPASCCQKRRLEEANPAYDHVHVWGERIAGMARSCKGDLLGEATTLPAPPAPHATA